MPLLAAALPRPFQSLRPSVDDPILAAARGGDPAAIDVLLRRYRDRIFNLSCQILGDHDAAEDATQEAFLRAFDALGKFRSEADFGTWLYRVAVNVSLRTLEKQNRQQRIAPTTPESTAEEIASANFSAGVDTRLALEAVLDAIPENHRVALMLREWHGLSYEEMAVVLDIPVGTVRSRLHEARRQFRTLWEAQS